MTAVEGYTETISELGGLFESFKENAELGVEGRGSKTKALQARKLSMEITNKLKDFRSLSITNDRSK
jgi:hypothetical protein